MYPALTLRYLTLGSHVPSLPGTFFVITSKATTLPMSPECFEILLGLNKMNSKLTNSSDLLQKNLKGSLFALCSSNS